MNLIQRGNAKLISQHMFNITTSEAVCGRICKGCYSAREQVRHPSALAVRDKRYEISLSSDFVSAMNVELKLLSSTEHKVLRLHSSGEFYSVEYINKWMQIFKANPEWTFYTFTKRFADFPTELKALDNLPNVYITDSLFAGTINYNKTGVVINPDTGVPLVVCPATLSKIGCDPDICKYCYSDNGSSIHGVAFKAH